MMEVSSSCQLCGDDKIESIRGRRGGLIVIAQNRHDLDDLQLCDQKVQLVDLSIAGDSLSRI